MSDTRPAPYKTLKELELEVAKATLALLSDISNWAQGTYAENANGFPTDVCSPDAVRFCAIGAYRWVARNMRGDISHSHYAVSNVTDALERDIYAQVTAHSYGSSSVVGLNDNPIKDYAGHTMPKTENHTRILMLYQDLITALEKAIEKERSLLNGTQEN